MVLWSWTCVLKAPPRFLCRCLTDLLGATCASTSIKIWTRQSLLNSFLGIRVLSHNKQPTLHSRLLIHPTLTAPQHRTLHIRSQQHPLQT